MTKFSIKIFSLLLATVVCATALAQDPDWHVVPKDDLSGNRGEIAKQLQTDADEATCLQVLQREGTDDDTLYLKMLACKRLGIYGTVAAVPQLVSMLEKTNEGFFARYALETIPGAEVDAALCEALPNLKDPAVIAGVLTTLGVRGNLTSAKTAFQFVENDDADVRKAAAYAFVSSFGEEAPSNLSGDSSPINIDSADAIFLLAERFAASGGHGRGIAAAIYAAIAKADIKAYQKESAVYQHILIQGEKGIDELVSQINSDDPMLFLVAMKAGRELPAGEAVTKAMVDQLDKQDNNIRKALLVRAIGDRKDAASKTVSLPSISKLAQAGDEKVRAAAIDALLNIGDASVLPTLIAAANQKDSEMVANAAKNTLANLPGAEVDAAIVGLLEKGDTAAKTTAIALIEERRIVSAFPQLEKGLDNSDANVRKAALDALGQVAGIDELPLLLGHLGKMNSQEDLDALQRVLKSACTRMPQDAATTEVVKRIADSPKATQLSLLELLMEIAGPKAVETVESYAWGDDTDLKNKAIALLGSWRSPKDVDLIAAACLKLAKEAEERGHRYNAGRGYIRLARQFDMPEAKRIEMATQMLTLQNRVEDKLLAFDVYSRYPSANMLAETMKWINQEQLQEKACETAVIIGEKTPDKSEAVAAAMKAVLEKCQNADVKARAQRVLDRQ